MTRYIRMKERDRERKIEKKIRETERDKENKEIEIEKNPLYPRNVKKERERIRKIE